MFEALGPDSAYVTFHNKVSHIASQVNFELISYSGRTFSVLVKTERDFQSDKRCLSYGLTNVVTIWKDVLIKIAFFD